LQAAFKHPTANLGIIIDEGTKRALRMVGLGSGVSLAEHVHPTLGSSGQLVARSIELLGATVESVLIKYGRKIIDEQFVLNRLANSAIEIYAMSSVLSRASRSLTQSYNSAAHEEMMATILCREGSERVQQYLGAVRSAKDLENYSLMSKISKDVCENGGVVARGVVGF